MIHIILPCSKIAKGNKDMAIFHTKNKRLYVINCIAAACLIGVSLYGWSWYQNSQNEQMLQQAQNGLEDLKKLRADVMADSIMNEVAASTQALARLARWNDYTKIRFSHPSDRHYNNNAKLQLMHPLGGGMQPVKIYEDFYREGYKNTKDIYGWQYQNKINVQWTDTNQSDVILSFLNINPKLCSTLNKRLHGDDDIPRASFDYKIVLVPNRVNGDLKAVDCKACENKESLCVQNNGTYAFYAIIGSR
jgi:hypothetical protein